MKKLFSVLLVLIGSLVLIACNKNYTEPIIEGLNATGKITLGESINVLEGVIGLEDEDKDVTSNIVISVNPATAKVENGVVTPTEEGSHIVTLTLEHSKDKELVTKEAMFLEVLKNDIVEEVSSKVYTFDKTDESALNGFTIKEDNSLTSALNVVGGQLVYTATKNANSKIEKELSITKDNTYTINVELKSSNNNVNSSIVVLDSNNAIPNASENNLTITNKYSVISYTFKAGSTNESASFILTLDNQLKDDVVTIRKFEVVTTLNPTIQEFDFNLDDEDNWNYYNDKGVSDASVVDSNLVIDITDNNAGIWEQKLIRGGVQLLPNKTYQLNYTITATENIKYEFIARTLNMQAGDREENYVWSATTLPKGETRTITHQFKTNENDINDFEMFFQVGNQETPVVITISDVTFNIYDVYETKTLQFSGLAHGFGSFEDDATADASLYIDTDNKVLVYDVKKFGDADWHNKFFIENVVFNDNSKYRIEFVAKASKEVSVFFAINLMGGWNPKVTDLATLTTEFKTYSYETDARQTFTQNMELLFQFGEFNKGEAVIEFESISIIELA